MSTTATQAPPHETIWSLTNGLVVSRCLHVVAELGVADHIGDAAVGVDQLAEACDADPASLDRTLCLLAAHGVFACQGGAYEHNDASRLLRSDHPMSMRAFTRMMGRPAFWASFGELEHSVRTATTGFETVDKNGFFGYLRTHPDEAAIFDEAMTAKAHADIVAVLGSYDFGRFGTIADIGGGRGHFLRAVLDATPSATGVLFDLPGVIDTLDPPTPRLRHHAGDFFVDPLPAADAFVLMEVIHDWPDREAAAILRAVRSASRTGATLLVVEAVIPDDHLDPRVHTLDLIMLSVTGGRERSADAFGALLAGAGFELTRVVPTGGPIRIVEATAA